ncbi:MAG: adenosylmethionine decarboxylase [Phycisphaerae bacterium]
MTTKPKTPATHATTIQIGLHWLADLSGVAPAALANPDAIMSCLRRALVDVEMNILAERKHEFPGGGFTGFFLLSESHAAIHTYPEAGYVAVDLFTCGVTDGRRVIDAVIAACAPSVADVRCMERSRTVAAQK